jgi:hypothetical protein
MPKPAKSATPTTPNALKEHAPDLFHDIEDFRARLENILLVKLDSVLDNPACRDRGHFLPRDDLRAIAHVVRILTKESWNEEDFVRFEAGWREAMRCDYFADAFESIRHRIQALVENGRAKLLEPKVPATAAKVTQRTLW